MMELNGTNKLFLKTKKKKKKKIQKGGKAEKIYSVVTRIVIEVSLQVHARDCTTKGRKAFKPVDWISDVAERRQQKADEGTCLLC